MVFALMTSSFAADNTYTVKSGDVLWKIAEKYETSWQEIAETNKLLTPHLIFPGNFVLAVSEGTFGGQKVSYFDLFRVEDGKIAEHWDVIENILEEDKAQNDNGKF